MQNGRENGTDRGKRASFDRRTGEVSGSGAGAGNSPDAREEYDSDGSIGAKGESSAGETPA